MFKTYPIFNWIVHVICLFFPLTSSPDALGQDSASMEQLLESVQEALSRPHTKTSSTPDKTNSIKTKSKGMGSQAIETKTSPVDPKENSRLASSEVFETEPIQTKIQNTTTLKDTSIQFEGHILSLTFRRGNQLQIDDTNYVPVNRGNDYAFGFGIWLQSREIKLAIANPSFWTGLKTQISFLNRDLKVSREGIYQDPIYMNSTDILISAPWILAYSIENLAKVHLGIGPNLHSTYLLSKEENISGYSLTFSDHWETGITKEFANIGSFSLNAFLKSWILNSKDYASSSQGMQLSFKRNL